MIDDTPGIDIDELAIRAKVEARKAPLDLIVVDFVQRLSAKGEVEQRFTNAVNGLQILMKQTQANSHMLFHLKMLILTVME